MPLRSTQWPQTRAGPTRLAIPGWFVPTSDGEIENIRVADDLLVDLLFAANGETYESVQPYVRDLIMRDLIIDGIPVRVLNIDGLIKTKTDSREKDLLDKRDSHASRKN